MPRAPHGAHALHRVAAWLPAAVTLPFLALFVLTALGRITTPFELEWNEGHTAEQAIRVAMRLPLYPGPESGWVPYMYAPLYHLLLGTLFEATGSVALGWGRAISLAASVASAVLAARIVWEESRSAEAAWCAAGLTAFWYRGAGYWHDLARVDALGQALALAGVWVMLGRGSGPWRWFWGALLMAAAAFTKQPLAVVPLVCVPALVWTRGRRAVFPLACAFLVVVNGLKYFIDAGNTHFLHYALRNATRHASWWGQLIPGGVRPAEFFAGLGFAEGLVRYAGDFPANPPPVWREAVRHVWLVAVIFAAGLAATRRARLVRMAPHMFTLQALTVVCVLGYVKFGGYVNNFMPMHLWLAVCVPLLWCGVRRRLRTPGADLALAAALLLQAWQPWAPSGLLWDPRDQWPSAEDARAHATMMRWLSDRRAAGERVLVAHHQFYGHLTGHGIATNVDMVRCAQWAGDPVPKALDDMFTTGEYDLVVLDQRDPEDDWLTPGLAGVITEQYALEGPVPGLVAEDGRWLMVPRTGAPVRPGFVFRRRPVSLPPDP